MKCMDCVFWGDSCSGHGLHECTEPDKQLKVIKIGQEPEGLRDADND